MKPQYDISAIKRFESAADIVGGSSGRLVHALIGIILIAIFVFCLDVSAQAAGSPSFASAVDYDAGSHPNSVTTGDFNQDGKTDLAVANINSHNISIMPGVGDGTFGAAVNYNTGIYPRSVTTGDFNNDGKSDLATANRDNISILMGNGDGTFAAAVNSGGGNGPESVTTGDFNNDGKPDLVVANYTGGVSVLLGNGDGTFGVPVNYGAGTNPRWVTTGDFNNDGKNDLAVANCGSNNVSILTGNGDGTFVAAVNYDTGSYPTSVTTGDFNRDGKTDLAVANTNSNNGSILLGAGDATFGAAVNFGVGTNPRSVITGDFNEDGMTDLAVANINSHNVSILSGAGDGSFGVAVNYGAGPNPISVTTGDLNGDGKTDLVTANNTGDNVSILINTTAIEAYGSFLPAINHGVGTNPWSVITGDFNADGKPDIATANSNSNDVSILLGAGDGAFDAAVNYGTGIDPFSVITGDFNRDGKTDLATANNNNGNSVSILLGNGNGTFDAAVEYDVGNRPNSVTSGDFNNDGKTDLATANYGSGNVSILLGEGDGTFAAAVNYTAVTNPISVTTGDFDRDGKTDLATANYGSGNVSILLGEGDGTFAAAVEYNVGTDPISVTTGDFNRDGKTDLAVSNMRSNNVSILLGAGAGTFAAAVNYTTGAYPFSVITGEFNSDGNIDLAVGSSSQNISIMMGTGDGTFATAENYAAGISPISLAARDFNGDGKTDLAVANMNSGNVSILINTSPRDYYWTWYDNIGGNNWVLLANPVTEPHDLIFNLSIGGISRNLAGYNNGVVVPGASITPIFSGVMDGPVKAISMTGSQGIVSQRILWPKGGNSLEEVPGIDGEKLSNHFYWTWYDDLSAGYTNYVMVANPGTATVYYRIKIAGNNQSDFPGMPSSGSIAPGQSAFWRDGTKRGGPVEVEAWSDGVDGSTPADVLASQRVLSNGGSAFNEVPGIPETELSGDYLWTWYDNHSAGAQNWIMIANPNGVTEMHYEIWIGGVKVQDDTTGGGTIPAGGNIFPTFRPPVVDAAAGPVQVKTFLDEEHQTPMDSIASQRVIWGPSFEEVPGYPYSALTNTYHWTWYDQSAAGVYNWVMVAKPDPLNPTLVYYKVLVGGDEKQPCTEMPAAGRDTPVFPGVIGGPVEVRGYLDSGCSTTPTNIMASQRILWKGYFNEVLGTNLE